ncbi:MAG: TIGR04084 family radical SAM/SPASM domain-containing protein [Methanospirillaceae archaeon]|nr:TIGR04084 family radical SAM/SPASM domain-containing protein [Methanospirillaceae archaeon]
MYYHLYITDECNLNCRYCRDKIFSIPEPDTPDITIKDIPPEITYPLSQLKRFISKDPEAKITFIGGEPTLRPEWIGAIMQDVPAAKWMIQTNGIRLKDLPSDITNRFGTILISIDGNQELTDYHRGKDTYRKAMESIQSIIARGYRGELIARMTVTRKTDIYAAVTHLACNRIYPFRSIHWQIDAGFWSDYNPHAYGAWSKNQYIPGIQRLADQWISVIKQERKVPQWYPFTGIIHDLLTGEDSLLRCGSGHANYTIQTDGTIIPCPIMLGIKDYYLGHINTSHYSDIKAVPIPKNHCTNCDIFSICGGRCLYSAVIRPWPDEGFTEICTTVRSYIKILQGLIPQIQQMMRAGEISADAFDYERYNGCEIIP